MALEERLDGAPAIRVEGLSKRYGRVDALVHLDLEVPPGEVLGYLGPNGAGKTTTIRLLLGFLRPSAGRAMIFGTDCTEQPVKAHSHTAFVPGEANLWPSFTGEESLELLGNLHGQFDRAYKDQLIERFGLDPSKKVRDYSRGNRQKVLIIAALMTKARLLLLDEPSSGLDPLVEKEFQSAIREARQRGQTIFLSSHSLSEVEALSDRVAILRDGRLAEVGALSQMRHLSAITLEVEFAAAAPDVSAVPGVSNATADGHWLRCQVQGPVEPLLQALAGTGVLRILSREPSLEELFLAYYGTGHDQTSVAPVAS